MSIGENDRQDDEPETLFPEGREAIAYVDTDDVPEFDPDTDSEFTDEWEGEADGQPIRSLFGSEREEAVE